jgi:hypothetical protein
VGDLGGCCETQNGAPGGLRRYAYGALGYLNQEDDGQGSFSVDAKVSDERCLEVYALCRALRI